MRLYWILIVGSLIISCKNETNKTKVRIDTMLNLSIEMEPGNNIIPIYNDTIRFVGLPAAIGVNKDNKRIPFLVLGKELEEGNDYLCHFIGSLDITTDQSQRFFGVALPVNDEYRTIDVDSYEDLTQSQPMLKLWLKDYFTFVYGNEVVKQIKWQNEIEILRKLKESNKR
jgi:hypothetical protein